MSHWAEIDETNTVVRVLVCDNDDPNGDEGYQWLLDNFGGTWLKTSYNAKIRYNFAGVGYLYDPIDDAFIGSKPDCNHPELVLTELKKWECSNVEHEIPTF